MNIVILEGNAFPIFTKNDSFRHDLAITTIEFNITVEKQIRMRYNIIIYACMKIGLYLCASVINMSINALLST